jgi:hypothetical protein
MWMARTYFLENIAKEEERGYSVYSSVTSCLEMLHCLCRNLTVRSSRNILLSGIIVAFSTIPPLHQFPFAEKTGSLYNVLKGSDFS